MGGVWYLENHIKNGDAAEMTQDPILEMMAGPRQREVYYWYGKYAATAHTEPHRVAVLKVSGNVVDSSVDALAEKLFWLQKYGFNPTLTFGWSESLTERLKTEGIRTVKINGDRVTGEREMEYVLDEAQRKGTALTRALESRGIRLVYLGPDSGVVVGKDKTGEGYGVHNGDVSSINSDPIIQATSDHNVPVVCIIGMSLDGKKLYNINNADVSAAIAQAMHPEFFGLVTGKAGVLGYDGTILPELVINKHYQKLVEDRILHGDMLKNVNEAKKLLEAAPDGYKRSVRVLGVDTLLPEMFYDRGGGTEIRLGYDIDRIRMADVNQAMMAAIVRESLGEELKDGFFRDAAEKASGVFWERYDRGFLVSDEDYINIMAVRQALWGDHLGTDLFMAFIDSRDPNPKAYWRSQVGRPANAFYERIINRFPSRGAQQFTAGDNKRYFGYWIGLTPAEVADKLGFMKAKPANYK